MYTFFTKNPVNSCTKYKNNKSAEFINKLQKEYCEEVVPATYAEIKWGFMIIENNSLASRVDFSLPIYLLD